MSAAATTPAERAALAPAEGRGTKVIGLSRRGPDTEAMFDPIFDRLQDERILLRA